jgi:hypothetical protein
MQRKTGSQIDFPPEEAFSRFENALRRVMKVSKKELDKRLDKAKSAHPRSAKLASGHAVSDKG